MLDHPIEQIHDIIVGRARARVSDFPFWKVISLGMKVTRPVIVCAMRPIGVHVPGAGCAVAVAVSPVKVTRSAISRMAIVALP
jgi:hypothetical protein